MADVCYQLIKYYCYCYIFGSCVAVFMSLHNAVFIIGRCAICESH